MNKKRVIKIFSVALVIVIVFTYGITAAFSAGWFKFDHTQDPNIVLPTGYTIPFSVGKAACFNGTVGTIWPFKQFNVSTPMQLSGSWNSNVSIKLIIIPFNDVKNQSFVSSLLNNTSWSFSGSINLTVQPANGGYQLTFVPGPNESGYVKITREMLLSPLS